MWKFLDQLGRLVTNMANSPLTQELPIIVRDDIIWRHQHNAGVSPGRRTIRDPRFNFLSREILFDNDDERSLMTCSNHCGRARVAYLSGFDPDFVSGRFEISNRISRKRKKLVRNCLKYMLGHISYRKKFRIDWDNSLSASRSFGPAR